MVLVQENKENLDLINKLHKLTKTIDLEVGTDYYTFDKVDNHFEVCYTDFSNNSDTETIILTESDIHKFIFDNYTEVHNLTESELIDDLMLITFE